MNYSLDELTDRMQGKSVTLGWDALVFMNRAKVNSLLEQQYITRFNRKSFLKRIFGNPLMTPDGEEYLDLSGLILTAPRIGFQKASLRNSRVTATMDIVSGTVSYVRKGTNQLPGAILYSYVVSAHQKYTVTMDIDLAASKGTVNEQGKVTLDFGDAYNCRCNLVSEDKSQELLGDFFKALFLEQKPEDRVYILGKLDLRDVDLLAPRSFIIRTMATEEGKNLASDDYGEGAVLLCVQAKGNPKQGTDPAEGAFDYLIPNNRDSQGKAIYSGSLTVASRVISDWYIQLALQNTIGNGISFERKDNSDFKARSLQAVTGGFDIPGTELEWNIEKDSYRVVSLGQFKLGFDNPVPAKAFNVTISGEGALLLEWSERKQQDFNFNAQIWGRIPPSVNVNYSIYPHPTFRTSFVPVVEPGNKVVLTQKVAPEVSCPIDFEEYDELFADVAPEYFKADFRNAVVGPMEEVFKGFDDIEIPELNFLAISNLLFPERNALQLTEARFPGDLFLVGQIDPKETTFTLDPLTPVIKAGEQQTFTIRQLGIKADNVTWNVRSIDGTRATGTIDKGVYTAPAVQLLEGTAVRNVVTATYIDQGTGNEVTASALATVVLNDVVVTPSMTLIDMSDRKAVTLKATSLGAGTLKWTPRGNLGTLVPNGNEAIYTPPQTNLPDGTLQAVLVDVENTTTGEKAVATVLLRQGNFALNMTPAIHPGLRAKGSALLKAAIDLKPEQLKWEVVAGQGTIDPLTGVFTAPASISVPYSVVKVSLEGDFFDTLGYSIIHLSDHARQSNWFALDTFDFIVDPSPTRVWANGLQQAKVTLRIKPANYEGAPDPLELSEAELASVRLVSADEKNPLPEVGKDGVPEGGKWYFTETENLTYDKYPIQAPAGQLTAPMQPREAKLYTKEFFVQCHKVENLLVAATIRSDNYEHFYSNPGKDDGEHNRKALNLVAIKPPSGGTGGHTLFVLTGPMRVKPEGGGADEDVLVSDDYYYLKLQIENKDIDIKKIQFVGNNSMVKWESNTQLEDVHSITGHAFRYEADPDDPNDKGDPNARTLHIDTILQRRLPAPISPFVDPNSPLPKGQVLFSLHRRQYWQYDKYAKSDFESALNLIVYDVFGNKHEVYIGFDGNDRNKLKIIGA
ncbi:hypothetical protein [Pseudomonas serbica]